jgi:hypothetical protein
MRGELKNGKTQNGNCWRGSHRARVWSIRKKSSADGDRGWSSEDFARRVRPDRVMSMVYALSPFPDLPMPRSLRRIRRAIGQRDERAIRARKNDETSCGNYRPPTCREKSGRDSRDSNRCRERCVRGLNYLEDSVNGNRLELTGWRFGRLFVLRYHHSERRHSYWLCRCDCGIPRIVCGADLNRAHGTRSCGCYSREKAALRLFKHGATRRGKITPEYHSWSHMLNRCTNLKHHAWNDYGGRGIRVCARWRSSFANFLADMKKRPPGTSLDRRNNDLGYFKSNCRWATAKMQRANQRPRKMKRAA